MTSANSQLRAEGLSMRFGGVRVFEDISFTVDLGGITACIGPNGAGKSTLVNVVCGVYIPVGGQTFLNGEMITGTSTVEIVRRGICRTFQDVRIFPTLTAIENVLAGIPRQRGEGVLSAFTNFGPSERSNRNAAMSLLDDLALSGVASRPAGELPFGQQKLIALARAAATGARFVLLDEPAAGVELSLLPNIAKLVRRLTRTEGRGVLLIEHNVDFVRELADQVFVLQGGGVLASGSVQQVLNDERVIKEYLGRVYDA